MQNARKRPRNALPEGTRRKTAGINVLTLSGSLEHTTQCNATEFTATQQRANPKLILAPMEVLADRQFRAAIGTVGGMDEAVHEFIRITEPVRASIHGVLRRRYDAKEMGSVPLAAQIMGGDPKAMGMATWQLADRYGAHRIDLNCGCPSKRVNGNGAGAVLLKSPEHIFEIVRCMVEASEQTDAVVSVKMRSGFESTALFDENVRAVVEAGARMLTVHPRTKKQAYKGLADWSLIKRAKDLCEGLVEVVGNGDVTEAADALRMLDTTGCDHVMIGRGAVANPWIFWEVREALAERVSDNIEYGKKAACTISGRVQRNLETEKRFFEGYLNSAGGIHRMTTNEMHGVKIGRLKMMLRHAMSITDTDKACLLRSDGGGDARVFLKEICEALSRHYEMHGGEEMVGGQTVGKAVVQC